MKNFIFISVVCLSALPEAIQAQILLTSGNQPAQTTLRNGIPKGASVYGVFVGRTPCEELAKELQEVKPGCAKRKLMLVLYHDPITGEPSVYEARGLGKWTGKGKWRVVRGTPADPLATVFELELDPDTHLFLLKGDDNVLFILDRNKNFLIGNAKHSYTMNRAGN